MMKLKKKLLLSAEMLSLLVVLTGCMQYDENKNPTGFIYDYLVVPTGKLIVMLAEMLNGNYGLAIIAITIIVRLAIMPMNFTQIKKTMVQQEKMKYIKPELEDIQFRQKNAQTPEEKAAVSQEMMALYKENNISMTGGVGCLPILIQMPIFTAMYQAVNLTPEISQSTFLGINLGVSSPLLAILAGVAYVIQGYVSTIGMPQETKSQMKSMLLMNPIMILMFSWSSPAGLALYWLAGGIFAAAQTALQNHMIKPKIQKQVEEEMKDRPIKKNVKMAKPVSPSAPTQTVKALSAKNQQTDGKKGRNAGKQSKS
ncbi:membrane protein insertase YidC [Trichococcus pasteurii]|uniref:Membrane protein insertase YidC n=2 Tax=root TaxID=1 RepID=A0A1W1ICF9_9LACT|nr:membrane protein insertase YidC [Trichococcus pasteurii]SFE41528.1 YidC/Oxa1 family membrane protein insertase [Trichococcus pasteurii]SLM50712.1 membrane insertase oxa1/alb3/yidc [Trichococcus pasteurii]SSB91593.1 membrane insertase oxa1/alb3/yidc [Trichococcus pasteurii]